MKKFLLVAACIFILVLGTGFVLSKLSGNQSYTVDVSRTAVITQLRGLNRYETTSFTIEKIIEARAGQESGLSSILFGDKILLIAQGEVIAGFDLSKLEEKDVQISGKNITIDLPAAEILVTKLDSEKTRVYDRRQGILNQGDKDLETKARVAAEQSIKDAACQGNILTEAGEKGRAQFEAILKTIGFETVIVNIPAGSCT